MRKLVSGQEDGAHSAAAKLFDDVIAFDSEEVLIPFGGADQLLHELAWIRAASGTEKLAGAFCPYFSRDVAAALAALRRASLWLGTRPRPPIQAFWAKTS